MHINLHNVSKYKLRQSFNKIGCHQIVKSQFLISTRNEVISQQKSDHNPYFASKKTFVLLRP